MKRRRGRPSKITDEMLTEIRVLAKYGMSTGAICANMGLYTSVLYRYFDKHPEFKEEVKTLQKAIEGKCVIAIGAEILAGNVRVAQWQLDHIARKKVNSAKIKTERLKQKLLQKELDGGVNEAPEALTTSEYWQKVDEYFSHREEQEGDE